MCCAVLGCTMEVMGCVRSFDLACLFCMDTITGWRAYHYADVRSGRAQPVAETREDIMFETILPAMSSFIHIVNR